MQCDWHAQLLRNEWFGRRWVVQEIALAKKATVHCGHRHVPWTDVSDAISLYGSYESSTPSSRSVLAGNAQGLGAFVLSFLADNALRKDAQGKVLERHWTTEDLLAMLPGFRAQNPLDTVYAILSVASDSLRFSVDYSKPPTEFFIEVFKIVVDSSKSLDIMF